MKILQTKTIASVNLVEISVSQDELEVFKTAIKFALKKLTEDEIEMMFGATKDEIEGILEDLEFALKRNNKSKLEPALV